MKFSEMQYSRPDMEALAAATACTLEALKAAPDAAGQIAAYDAYEKQQKTACGSSWTPSWTRPRPLLI